VLLKLEIEQIEGMVFPRDTDDDKLFIKSSGQIINYLKIKASSHNKLYPKARTNINQLKEVFSNAPVDESTEDVVTQAIAYVNEYLKMKRNKNFKGLYNKQLNLIIDDNQIIAARKELEDTKLLDIRVNSLDNLYIENYEKNSLLEWFDV
jgi:hypothetical protein